MSQKGKKRRYDYSLLTAVFLLVGIGLVILYSTSAYNGEVKFHDSFYYLKKQAFATVLGIILMFVMANIDYHIWQYFAVFAYVIALIKFHDSFYYLKKQAFATVLGIILMFVMANIDYHIWQYFAVFAYVIALILSTAVLFIGDEYNGSKRWLSLGPFSFQPSEYAKVALILFLSYIVMKNVKKIDKVRTLIKIIGSTLPIVALVGSNNLSTAVIILGLFLSYIVMKNVKKIDKVRTLIKIIGSTLPIVALVGSNNLSTAVIILGIAIILIFVSSPKYTQFITMGILAVGFLGIFLALESYRLERLAIWRNPEKYEKGYQTLQGLYAIGSGGLFGRGLGSSIQKLGFVPEAQNDMIFSIICEELGLFGAIFIIILFVILIWRFFVIATHAKDLFGALIATGAMGHIMIQVILNIAVVTNSIPNTGITLPFISYGGTSVMFLLLEMGLVLSVSNLIE